MHKKLGMRLGLQVGLAIALVLAACGGDDDKSESGSESGGSGGAGGRSSAAGSGGRGGGSGQSEQANNGPEPKKEGAACKSNSDCDSDLSCLKADANVPDLKVCARHCSKGSDCNDGERCLSTSEGDPEQALCWKMVSEALKPCGPAFTTMCDGKNNDLGCLRVESENGSVAGGVCLKPCSLKEKDSCDDGFSCLDIIDRPDDGLCVHTVKRGDTCDEPSGKFCEPGNACLSDSDEWRCYQECSDSKKCDDDKECKPINDTGDGSYCE